MVETTTRESIDEFFVLREGIPEGLLNSLLRVFEEYFVGPYGPIVERTDHLARLTERALPQTRTELLQLAALDHELLLDDIDHALQYSDGNNKRHSTCWKG